MTPDLQLRRKWILRAHGKQVVFCKKAYERCAPFDLLRFPPDSAERFVDDRGHIQLTHADLTWKRLP